MVGTLDHVRGNTFHARHGDLKNAFRYGVDYVLTDMSMDRLPALFSRNGGNVTSLHDTDHGGERDHGRGLNWVHDLLDIKFPDVEFGRIMLLAQPRIFGHVFNPVSFWMIHNPVGDLVLVIAEVNNTFGERHSYLCHHDNLSPITPKCTLESRKIFHVSPFQKVDGGYQYRFTLTDKEVAVWINFSNERHGVVATFEGAREPLTNVSILKSLIKRPLGSRRVLALIHWQALKLWIKGAIYTPKPTPPAQEVSR